MRELSLPILNADQPGWDLEKVRTLLAGVRQAHGLIVASPVYQQTVSGALKNALDYLAVLENEEPPGLFGKVIGLVSVTGSQPSMGASLAVRAACQGLGVGSFRKVSTSGPHPSTLTPRCATCWHATACWRWGARLYSALWLGDEPKIKWSRPPASNARNP